MLLPVGDVPARRLLVRTTDLQWAHQALQRVFLPMASGR